MTEQEITNSKILIVDDEQENILILKKILRGGGFINIDCEYEPQNVLKRECTIHYDLVLLNLQMPLLDGFEVMKLFSAYDSDACFILTVDNKPETEYSALDKGAKDFITKPFHQREVISRIRNILDARFLQKLLTEKIKQLEKSCHLQKAELLETRMDAIKCLEKAAEFRDSETGMHLVRMSMTSARIAKELGWDEKQCSIILLASQMHDIGKIGIPDNILLKPEPLDSEEWKVMQSHTTIGEKILSISASNLFIIAAEIAISHHEKWDGSGYPKGLVGENIPIMGRIVAVSDVFDALMSKRAYKGSWSTKEAISYIRVNSKKHFDPDVVDAFNSCIEDIITIHGDYSDESQQKKEKPFLPILSTFRLNEPSGNKA